MSNQTDAPALDRLRQFDRRARSGSPTRVDRRLARRADGGIDRAAWRCRRFVVCRCSVCCCSRSVWRCRSCSRPGCSPERDDIVALALEPALPDARSTVVGCAIVLDSAAGGRRGGARLPSHSAGSPAARWSPRWSCWRWPCRCCCCRCAPTRRGRWWRGVRRRRPGAVRAADNRPSTRTRSPTSCCSAAMPDRAGGGCAPTR